MSRKATLVATDTVGLLPKAEHVFFPSGGDQVQVTVTFSSGRRMRINEGQSAFANAMCLRPGDVCQFEVDKVQEGSFVSNPDTPKAKTIPTFDYIGVEDLKVIEVGTFSDKADDNLLAAGRTPVEIKEKVITPKETPPPPPAPSSEGGAAAGAGAVDESDAPFNEH